MEDWIRKLFIERADVFLKIMDEKWIKAEKIVNGMLRILSDFDVVSGNLLDLFCGNGRISIHMAKKGFTAVGVDISKPFIEDAKRKALEHGVVEKTVFIEGDARQLKEVLKNISKPFDVVVSAWTSIGYYSQEEEYNIFKQARELSREGAILFILDTVHSEFISLKFTPTAYSEVGDFVILENRKYDPRKSQLTTTWKFYRKQDEDLKFIDRVDFQLHVYSLSELVKLLERAGWETIAQYGDISTLQPMNPLTSLNIVAKAI